MTKLSFYQSDSPMSESFWQKNSLVTLIFFAYFDILPIRKFWESVSRTSDNKNFGGKISYMKFVIFLLWELSARFQLEN